MKDIQKIKEFFSKPLKETIKDPSDAIDFLNKNKDKINKIANQYKGDTTSMQLAIDDFLAPYIEDTPEFVVTRLKAAIGKAISKMNIKADPDLSATYDKLKNAKTFVGESNKPQFKKGDKVTYLGHPGEITAVNKEMTGEITYSVAYDKGQGRTKASNINLKSGAIKPLEEALNPEVISKVNRFIKALANHYDYSEQDAVYAIMQALRTTDFQGINEAMTTAYENNKLHKTIPEISNGTLDIEEYKAKLRALEKPYESNKKALATIQKIYTSHIAGLNSIAQTLKEAKEEDAVDTITMDIPLFLRMLEYSREDAEQDLDLHDVTEKANKLGKERGILQMDDYEEIVGAAEEDMNEGMGGQLDEPFFIQVSVRDARKAMDMFNDMYRNSNIKTYGSDVYAADTPEDIYDFFYDLNSSNIEILDANVDEEDYDYDSEYEKTLVEKILSKIKEKY